MTVSSRKSRVQFLGSVLRQRYGTGLAIALPVMGLFGLLAFLSPGYYRAVGQLKLLASQAETLPNDAGSTQSANLTQDLNLLRSKGLALTTVQQMQKNGTSTQNTQESLRRSLSLKADPDKQTITLFFKDPNPKTAAAIVNKHMDVFKANKEQAQQSFRSQARQQIERRLPQAKENVAIAQREIKKFREKFQVVTATQSSSSAAVALKQAQQDLNLAQQQNAALDAQRTQLLQKLGINAKEAEILAAVSQSQQFRNLIQELRQLQGQLKRKQSELTEQHPEVINLERDIADLRTGLNSEIQRVTGNQTIRLNLLLERETKQVVTSELIELENQRAANLKQIQLLNQSLTELNRNVLELPQIEQQSQRLEQQLSQAQKQLEGLLQQREDVILALNNNMTAVQILNRAEVPQRRIAPFQKPLLLGGIVTSLGLAGLGMWIADRRDRSLRTVADAEAFLGLRVLGVIPTFESPSPAQLYDGDLQRNIPAIFPVDQPGAAVSEAFRMLYLNLKVLPNTQHVQSIAITSSIPQEGKSTIAANLAAVLAQAGQSVLLIDANLYHPFQSLIWNLPNEIGLSDILFSQTSFLLAVNPISSNLDVLTSGSIKTLDRNPFESKQMKLFIADMSSRYDCLLFDLPSVNVSADAAIISQMVDGVLFVSKPGQLDEFNASKAQMLLGQTQANLLGMILNGSDDPRDTFLPQKDNEMDEDLDSALLSSAEDELVLSDPNFSHLGQTSLNQAPLLSDTMTQSLESQSLPELERQLDELQSQWAASKRLLDNKEEELIHLCHARKELEVQLNQMSLSLDSTEDRGAKLEALHEQIHKTDARRDYLQRNIKTLREQIKAEQNTFYSHLKVLQSQHHRRSVTGRPPIT